MANIIESQNKTIAKNTIFLYLRMGFAMLVNLYSSRLLLNELGIDDYGVYSIIGGIVAIMMFINTAMQGATSRFITYSLGKSTIEETRSVINASIHIHLWIMLFILLIGETIGLWFFNTQITIPEESKNAALWVYHFSVLASCFAVLQVPFNAVVISYEKMDVYAIIEICNVILRCLIIFALPLFINRLIAYAFLLFVVSVFVFILYIYYCKKHIAAYLFSNKYNKEVVRPMISFAAWSLYGNGTYAVSQQGTNIFINRFFGVTLNAASGIATQASSVLSIFVANVQTAFNPQIIKEYSLGNLCRMQNLMQRECEIMLLLAAMIFTPLFVNMNLIMEFWLGEVPLYSVSFCRLLLIANVIQILTNIIAVAIQATGKNKLFSFLIGTVNLLCLAFVGISFYLGLDAYYAYIMYTLSLLLKLIIESFLINRYVPELRIFRTLRLALVPIIILIMSFVITYYLTNWIDHEYLKLLVSIVINTLMIAMAILFVYPVYKGFIISYLKSKMKNKYGKRHSFNM